MLWINSNNGTFIAQKNYMQGLKSAILAIFQTGPGWPSSVSGALKNPSQDFKNFNEFLAMLKGKIGVTPFFLRLNLVK